MKKYFTPDTSRGLYLEILKAHPFIPITERAKPMKERILRMGKPSETLLPVLKNSIRKGLI